MMCHWDFRSFSPKENMQRISNNQRYSFEVVCKHTSQLHAWRKDLGPLCSPISKSLHLQQDCADYNTNRWKDFLAISTEAHASLLLKTIFNLRLQMLQHKRCAPESILSPWEHLDAGYLKSWQSFARSKNWPLSQAGHQFPSMHWPTVMQTV